MKKVVSIGILFFLLVSFHLTVRVEILKFGYRRTRAISLMRRLEERNRELNNEISRLKSPERLRKVGKKLGLCPPKEGQIVFVGD